MPFTREQKLWRQLLRKYKSFECLWYNNDKSSFSTEECDNAWLELVEMAQEISEGADKAFVQRRINSFRAISQREDKRVEAALANGKTYQPKNYYYDIFKSMFNELEKAELDDSITNDELIIKAEMDCYEPDENEEILPEAQPPPKRPRTDTARILARRMAEHLEQMDSDQALIAEKIISDICVYGRLKKLNLESTIVLQK